MQAALHLFDLADVIEVGQDPESKAALELDLGLARGVEDDFLRWDTLPQAVLDLPNRGAFPTAPAKKDRNRQRYNPPRREKKEGGKHSPVGDLGLHDAGEGAGFDLRIVANRGEPRSGFLAKKGFGLVVGTLCETGNTGAGAGTA